MAILDFFALAASGVVTLSTYTDSGFPGSRSAKEDRCKFGFRESRLEQSKDPTGLIPSTVWKKKKRFKDAE